MSGPFASVVRRLAVIGAVTIGLFAGAATVRAEENAPGPASAYAQKAWGDLSGRIVVEGDVPKGDFARQFADVCGDIVVYDDSLNVGSDGGIADAFVWLERTPAAIHPDREAERRLPVRLAIDACRIQPHAATVQTGQSLIFRNLDEVGHVPRVETFANADEAALLPPAAQGIPAGRSLERVFARGETAPCPVRCAIHPWMSAVVLPVEHPYAAVTDATGRFRIEKLPVGEHRFRLWHERTGWLAGSFIVDGNEAAEVGERGRLVRQVAEGGNDLGTLKLGVETLSRK